MIHRPLGCPTHGFPSFIARGVQFRSIIRNVRSHSWSVFFIFVNIVCSKRTLRYLGLDYEDNASCFCPSLLSLLSDGVSPSFSSSLPPSSSSFLLVLPLPCCSHACSCLLARPVILGVGWQLVRLVILQKINIVERPELAGTSAPPPARGPLFLANCIHVLLVCGPMCAIVLLQFFLLTLLRPMGIWT